VRTVANATEVDALIEQQLAATRPRRPVGHDQPVDRDLEAIEVPGVAPRHGFSVEDEGLVGVTPDRSHQSIAGTKTLLT
jgi:hypothetical protein